MPNRNREKSREYSRKWRENNLEKALESQRRYYEYNKEKWREWNKNNPGARRKNRIKYYEKFVKKRNLFLETVRPKPDKCEVPGCERSDVVWDHCHGTSLFRSWLCGAHNKAAGLLGDDPHEIIKFGLFLLAEQQRVDDRAAALKAERKQQDEELRDNHL